MDIQQFIQLARPYWWLPLCPAAAVLLLTPLMRLVISAGAIAVVIWAIRKKPIKAEVVCTTTQNNGE